MKTKSKRSGISVTLPDLASVPAVYRGKPYLVRNLLAKGDTNTKMAKSNASSKQYRTFGLSLAPANSSGHQLCASSSAGCREACLFRQGRGSWPNTQAARIAKAIAFVNHRDRFESMLRRDLKAAASSSKKAGFTAAVRLNVVSDAMWEAVLPWVFSDFQDVQFYDYTKHVQRALKFAKGDGPANYHLTFSRSEANDNDCLAVLKAGGNVAVVFREKPLPVRWGDYLVQDGDQTDLRFLDPPSSVIGLTAKGTAKKETSGFVVDAGRFALPVIV
jgi:hypothetical protein